ncbi:C6 zinc finger domain-containing protein [Colletotrichum costaricense]|uniref:C6 zinc finger domain-containing protein n=1 Tax=Colletotrichum costaricense TaxID=1209916 RepID=A0AAI9YUK3_9PEZI|nr:C6 zinc finger domain-containing protein [Colletotrichum costaricense]KAK1524493.1 C6 zinc finger domain-containing protein [Colletotrichum costaricense]
MRRQNSSCDQCRKGKRACDAGALKDIQLCLDADLQWEVDWQSMNGPCSNCSKTRKSCTFNWARSQQAQLRVRRQSAEKTAAAAAAGSASASAAPSRKRVKSTHCKKVNNDSSNSNKASVSPASQGPSVLSEAQLAELQSLIPDHVASFTHETPSSHAFGGAAAAAVANDFGFPQNLFTLSPADEHLTFDPSADDAASLLFPGPSSLSAPSCLSDELPGFDDADLVSMHGASTISLSPDSTCSTMGIDPNARKRAWQQTHAMNYAPPGGAGISEYSATQALIARTNQTLMTDNLMKLYHDVMEGALSCWLVEQNCPYILTPTQLERSSLGDARSHDPTQIHLNLPNRIYRRVFKLDKSLASLGLKSLSVSEDRKATRALHLAIMAFTAQWAQGSQRSQARYQKPNGFGDSSVPGTEQEFDTALQISFWNQAQRCLDDCAGVDSFKVAMAELLFGLTQKNQESAEGIGWEFSEGMVGQSQLGYDYTNGDGNDWETPGTKEKVQTALDEEGYSLYVERGARRLHVLKRRSENFERRKRVKARGTANARTESGWAVGGGEDAHGEEKATMKMLFWLAIMFDTLSSAISDRPPVVSDEDSRETATAKKQNSPPCKGEDDDTIPVAIPSAESWNDQFIIKRNQKLAPLRWPCPTDTFERELRDAAPVKVLLFRKITRIQALSSRGSASPKSIEDAIQDGLAVYRHWNMMYGPLFRDCIEHHDAIPSKIQSWYICLLGHWLLAAMMMADCIALVDEQGLGSATRAAERVASGLVGDLRRASVREVSDLARAATPQHDVGGLGVLLDFHPAVKEGALLTEPWTMVLIRSFAMAGTLLLEEAGGGLGVGDEVVVEALDRCEDCVKALWYLGRKSTLSRQVAGILGGGLLAERAKGLSVESMVGSQDSWNVFGPVEIL